MPKAKTQPDYTLIAQPSRTRARIEFVGVFAGRQVRWDATVVALDTPMRRRAGWAGRQYIEVGEPRGASVPIKIGLSVPVIDAPTLAKTVIMVRNYKRLRAGRLEFEIAPRARADDTPSMPTVKIVSGGQTGVDRAALDAALELGLKCGGYCPKGRRAEDGPIPDRYPLRETTSIDYRERTRRNVLTTDATLILARGALSGGTALTYRLAQELDKPCLIVDLRRRGELLVLRRWLANNRVAALNVAGPRESQQPGIYQQALALLRRLFEPLAPSARSER